MLCHDITQIIKDEKKDVALKGHIIRKEGNHFLSVGKETLCMGKPGRSFMKTRPEILYDICKNKYMGPSPVKEGR